MKKLTLDERKITVGVIPGMDRLENVSFVVTTKEMEALDCSWATRGTKKFHVNFTQLDSNKFSCNIVDTNVNDGKVFLGKEFLDLVSENINVLLPDVAEQLSDLSESWIR